MDKAVDGRLSCHHAHDAPCLYPPAAAMRPRCGISLGFRPVQGWLDLLSGDPLKNFAPEPVPPEITQPQHGSPLKQGWMHTHTHTHTRTPAHTHTHTLTHGRTHPEPEAQTPNPKTFVSSRDSSQAKAEAEAARIRAEASLWQGGGGVLGKYSGVGPGGLLGCRACRGFRVSCCEVV